MCYYNIYNTIFFSMTFFYIIICLSIYSLYALRVIYYIYIWTRWNRTLRDPRTEDAQSMPRARERQDLNRMIISAVAQKSFAKTPRTCANRPCNCPLQYVDDRWGALAAPIKRIIFVPAPYAHTYIIWYT